MRSNIAALLCLLPIVTDAQQCGTAKGPNGEPAWAMSGDSSNGWHDREAYRCVTVCGGFWETNKPYGKYWCSKASGSASAGSATPGVDALASVVAARAAGQRVDGNTQTMAVGAAAFDLGAALHDYLAAEARNGRAQAAAEAAARAAAARRRAEEDARRRESSLQRLRGELKTEDGTNGGLAPKVEGGGELALKFGEEPEPAASRGPPPGVDSDRSVMPARKQGTGPVKFSRYTPADPPGRGAAGTPAGSASSCGSVGKAELHDGNVVFPISARDCPTAQYCWVIVGDREFGNPNVGGGAEGEIPLGRLPAGVQIQDYEKVMGVRKGCRAIKVG